MTTVDNENWAKLCEWMEPKPKVERPGPEWNTALYSAKWWVPAFTKNGKRYWVPCNQTLDACAIAEAEIERRGLITPFLDALNAVTQKDDDCDDKPPHTSRYRLSRATAQQRCRALLKAVEGVK